MLDLYFWPTANGIKIPVLLEELGVAFHPVPLNIRAGEHNHLYQHTDDGTQAGHAVLQATGTVEVSPRSGIALLPDDIHAVEIRGDAPIRHLHLYGRSLETLNERIRFDTEKQTYERMPIGVATRRQEDVYDIHG
jgi:hypothetical protein